MPNRFIANALTNLKQLHQMIELDPKRTTHLDANDYQGIDAIVNELNFLKQLN